VFRRSTTLCTWPSAFDRADRSIVTFMQNALSQSLAKPARTLGQRRYFDAAKGGESPLLKSASL
jgi:hypothetical protein